MMETLERELTAPAYGGRPHWGQRNWMDATRARAMYGDRWDCWVAQYRRFNRYGTFDNAFTDRMCLSRPEAPHCEGVRVSGACGVVDEPDGADDWADVRLDFGGIDAWVACARSGGELERCFAASRGTEGGRRAAAAVGSFGVGPPTPDADPARVKALLAEMKAWPAVVGRVARFFPRPVGGPPLRAFVVANGHPWGEAYVRAEADGEPFIVLNAYLMAARYRGDAAAQARSAYGVLAHEVFHALFARYRSQHRSHTAAGRSPTYRLAQLVLDEGIAHFIAGTDARSQEELPAEAAAALPALAQAWARLRALPADSAEANAWLRRANEGPYWEKYGAIAGMVMAYGIDRALGETALRDAVRCGPRRMLSLYRVATERAPTLPPLPAPLDTAIWPGWCSNHPPDARHSAD